MNFIEVWHHKYSHNLDLFYSVPILIIFLKILYLRVDIDVNLHIESMIRHDNTEMSEKFINFFLLLNIKFHQRLSSYASISVFDENVF